MKGNKMNIGTWNKIRCKTFLLLAGCCVLLAGCSKPSAGDGQQAVQNQINQDAQGRIRLVEFHKTNGQSVDVNAVKVYSLEFEAEIEFTADCKWITGISGSDLGFRTVQLPNKSLSVLGQWAADDGLVGAVAKQGQRVKVSGVIQFEKKENGWFVDQVKLTQYVAENVPQSATATLSNGQSQGAGVQSQTKPPIPAPDEVKTEATKAPILVPTEAKKEVAEAPPISESAEAWEFDPVKEELPRGCSLPAFSHDFSKMVYVAHRQLVVRPLDNSMSIKSIQLPSDVSSLAFSPDEKKIACLTVDWDSNGRLLFVDLETGKITPIRLDLYFSAAPGDDILAWPNENTIYVHQSGYHRSITAGKCLNLDTLQTTEMDDKTWNLLEHEYQVSNHKNAEIQFCENYINGSGVSLAVLSTKVAYGHILVFNAGKEDGDNPRRYGWSPDLHFFFEWKSEGEGAVCTIFRFVVRPKPRFEDDFQLKGLESALSEDQRKAISEALTNHKQVWFTMYHAQKNPLNDKTLGPDRSVALGRGLVTSLGDAAHVTYGVERLPISDGDVAADFWIRDGDKFGDVWATITRVGN